MSIECLDAARKYGPVIADIQGSDDQARFGCCHRLRADAAAMLRKCAREPLAGLGRMDHRLEEGSPVPLRQVERLMLGDGPPRCLRDGREAIVADLAPLELRSALDQTLGLLVEPELKTAPTDDTFTAG